MNADIDEAIVFLYQFIGEMNRWEMECNNRDRMADNDELDIDDAFKEDQKELDEITVRYLTKSALKRSLNFGEPPEYDPEREKFVEFLVISENKICVTTKQTTGFKHTLIYEMVKDKSGWKLEKRFFIDFEGFPDHISF